MPITVAGAAPWEEDPELEAAWTVAAVLSGRPERRDKKGAPPGTHDFDVHFPGGRTAVLEVTSMTVGPVVGMWRTISQLDWACPELTYNWSISLHAATREQAGTRVRPFRAKAAPLLAILERHNRGRVGDILGTDDPDRTDEEQQAIAELRRLGARTGGPVHRPASGPALVVVGTVRPGGAVDGSAVNEGVERAAGDNIEKLLRASGDERHLFMWVDSTDPDANAAMATFALPGPPRLDDGIDCVWVGLWQRNVNLQSNAGILWRLTPPGTWENVHVPLVRDYALAVVGGPVAIHG